MAATEDLALDKAPAAQSRLHWLIVGYILVLIIPIEFSIYIGTLLITPIRGYLLIVSFPIFFMFLMRKRISAEDVLMVFFASWVLFSFTVRMGTNGIDLGGQRFLEILVSYCLARTLVNTRRDIAALARILAVVIGILGVLAIPEAISHFRFLHEVPKSLTGFYYYISADTRMGMLRAASSFEHPILFGLFAASSLAFMWYTTSSPRQRFWRTILAGNAAFFSLSSAAILVFGLQAMLIALELSTRWLKHRLTFFTVSLVSVIAFLELASNRGSIRLIASYLTFSAHTAYYRISQWNYTIDDVFAHPLFGLSQGQWTRPGWLTDSIDNYWLFIGFQNGIPAVLAIWGAFLVIFIKVLLRAKKTHDPSKRAVELSWIVAAIALFLGGWTVTYFGKMTPYFAFFLGVGSAITRMRAIDDDNTPTAPEKTAGREAIRFTRFAADEGSTATRLKKV